MDRELVDDIKRHMDVVGEELRSELRALVKSQLAINERLDRLDARLADERREPWRHLIPSPPTGGEG
jgi:hypothetical protein